MVYRSSNSQITQFWDKFGRFRTYVRDICHVTNWEKCFTIETGRGVGLLAAPNTSSNFSLRPTIYPTFADSLLGHCFAFTNPRLRIFVCDPSFSIAAFTFAVLSWHRFNSASAEDFPEAGIGTLCCRFRIRLRISLTVFEFCRPGHNSSACIVGGLHVSVLIKGDQP